MFVDAGVVNVGFQLSWEPQFEAEGNIAATFIASNFLPVNATDFEDRAARWALIDHAYGH